MLVSLAEITQKAEILGKRGYLPTQEESYTFLNIAFVKFAEEAKPYSLMRNSKDFSLEEPLVFLDECNYIAYPPKITEETQNIELESELIDLFVWCYLSVLNADSKEFVSNYKKGLAEYRGRRIDERFGKSKKQTWLSELI